MNLKKHLIPVLERTLSLLVVALMLAAAAVSAGRLWGKDIAPDDRSQTEAATAMPTADQLRALHLEGSTLQPADSFVWRVRDKAGTEAGVLISTASATLDGEAPTKGFAGPVSLLVHIDREGRVRGMVALPHQETPSFLSGCGRCCKPTTGLP